MLKEETITGPGYSFVCSNRKRTGQGVVYMTDAEYAAHKAEQEASAKQALVEKQDALAQAAAKDAAITKLAINASMTEEEIRKLLT